MPRNPAALNGRLWADLQKREQELIEHARTIVKAAPRQRYTIEHELADIHRLLEQLRPVQRRA